MDQEKSEVQYRLFRLEVSIQLIRVLLSFCFMALISSNSPKGGMFPINCKIINKQSVHSAFQVYSNIVLMHVIAAQITAKELPALRITKSI